MLAIHGNMGFRGGGGLKPLVEGLEPPQPPAGYGAMERNVVNLYVLSCTVFDIYVTRSNVVMISSRP